MSVPSNTFQTYDTVGIREDLQDLIYNVDPTETPFVSMIAGQGTAKQTRHEWQTQELRAPDRNNAVIEGRDADLNPVVRTSRPSNHTQIMDETAVITGTNEATDRAGRDSEMGYQLMLKSLELRRDMEAIVTGSQASSAGVAADPGPAQARVLGALENCIVTNISHNGAGDTPGYAAGEWGDVTDGTARNLTDALVEDVIEQVWNNSTGSQAFLMCSGKVKQNFSTLKGSGQIQRRQEAETAKVTQTVDIYQSDFEMHRVIPNRFQRDFSTFGVTTLFVLDPTLHTMAYLRPFRSWPLAKTGDTEKRQILVEVTYCAKNEKGNGKVADLNDSVS